MTDRPILFSAPMVRAILAGTKTQTRRAFPMQPPAGVRVALVNNTTQRFGGPGDRLWVRESFRLCAEFDTQPPSSGSAANRVWYEADAPHQPGFGKGRPSIHMPRWASRILLEITDVRIERLQAISYEDAIAEGCLDPATVPPMPDGTGTGETLEAFARRKHYPQRCFADLWESINGADSWAANPWVWVITFRRSQ